MEESIQTLRDENVKCVCTSLRLYVCNSEIFDKSGIRISGVRMSGHSECSGLIEFYISKG